MSFAAPVFLWYFLPVVLAGYFALPPRRRNLLLTVASLLFYTWGAGAFVLMLVALVVFSWSAGLLIGLSHGSARGRAVLAAAVVADLVPLLIWKYAGFAVSQLNAVIGLGGFAALHVPQLALPIGFSFFTFHCLSYLVDVERGVREPQRSLVDFATYIVMFPQLVAGPIVRYHEIAVQLGAPPARRHRLDDFIAGFPRFAWGLTKKVLVADSVAAVVRAGFGLQGADLSFAAAWVATLAFAVQIYFDFSGYSDMAIGIGRMFGFILPENFDRPYSAESVTEFWRRWHMSLSRWFRDYLYVPLGGNRHRASRTYLNLVVVFLLTGIWHGAGLTFLAWGAYHGAWLVVERIRGVVPDPATTRPLRRVATFLIVCGGWAIFRAPDLSSAGHLLAAMANPTAGLGLGPELAAALTSQRTWLLAAGLATLLLPRHVVFGPWLQVDPGRRAWAARLVVASLGVAYSGLLVASGTFSPFLYFRF